jgi:hypothetical protein
MPEHDPIGNDVREARRERTFGPDAVCVLCLEPDLVKLRPVDPKILRDLDKAALRRCARSTLELDHLVGKAIDKHLTVPLCHNCHLEVTELRRCVGASMKAPPTTLHAVRSAVLSLVAAMPKAQALGAKMADGINGVIDGLDRELPSWRTKTWARWPWTH